VETKGERGSGLRAAIERRSAAPVVFLHRLPRWALLVAVFLLLVVGMAGTGWVAAAGLLVLAVALAWFAYLNWPELDGSGRVLRVVALAILVGFALGRGIGRF
jgi:energy-coupling factor transporter transmembrane protein EcfT